MSVEISDATIARVYESLEDGRIQDWVLVVGRAEEAELERCPMDGAFEGELAEERRHQAFDLYRYPVEGTAPTLRSSLWIVRGILKVRELELSSQKRLQGVDLIGLGDIALLRAEGQERSHRLWEKGVLRIFDQHTSRSMWSVEFDDSLVAK